jgi:hypothetical protein
MLRSALDSKRSSGVGARELGGWLVATKEYLPDFQIGPLGERKIIKKYKNWRIQG